MTNYNNIFDDYIKNNNLTLDNVAMKLEKIGYVSFFNDITTTSLGQAPFIHTKKQNKSTNIGTILNYLFFLENHHFLRYNYQK